MTETSEAVDLITATLDRSQPPKDLSLPMQALWWIAKGEFRSGPEWDKAHDIVVSGEGHQPFDWVHALMHWIEADFGSADYWYRQAGTRRATANVKQEWALMVEKLGS